MHVSLYPMAAVTLRYRGTSQERIRASAHVGPVRSTGAHTRSSPSPLLRACSMGCRMADGGWRGSAIGRILCTEVWRVHFSCAFGRGGDDDSTTTTTTIPTTTTAGRRRRDDDTRRNAMEGFIAAISPRLGEPRHRQGRRPVQALSPPRPRLSAIRRRCMRAVWWKVS